MAILYCAVVVVFGVGARSGLRLRDGGYGGRLSEPIRGWLLWWSGYLNQLGGRPHIVMIRGSEASSGTVLRSTNMIYIYALAGKGIK